VIHVCILFTDTPNVRNSDSILGIVASTFISCNGNSSRKPTMLSGFTFAEISLDNSFNDKEKIEVQSRIKNSEQYMKKHGKIFQIGG
jgi:hypothetical protein